MSSPGGTEIRPARSDRELRQAYALRARVFVGEQILNRRADDGLLFDVYDALPSSETFVALDDGEVTGTVRITIHDGGPSPSDDFDIPAGVLPDDARLSSGSMLCVKPDCRQGTLGLRLVSSGMRAAASRGSTHALAPIRPEAVPIFQRLGWFELAEPYMHPIEQVPVVPMGSELNAATSDQREEVGETLTTVGV